MHRPNTVTTTKSPEGRDIFRVGDAIGIGAVAAMVNGKLVKVGERTRTGSGGILAERTGALDRGIEYDGWNAGGKIIHLKSRITHGQGNVDRARDFSRLRAMTSRCYRADRATWIRRRIPQRTRERRGSSDLGKTGCRAWTYGYRRWCKDRILD